MAEPSKDTIYIDIDDEITGIIDKLHGSSDKVVALVLPKRAGVFQSIVNMKLLKRAADDAKKNLVLITTEAGLMPLAGAAGIHVAKTINSKPEIPLGPQIDADDEESVNESGEEPEITADTAGDQPVGKLADLGAAGAAADGVETLELDDDDLPEDSAGAPGAVKPKSFEPAAAGKAKKNKKLKVPNFERFRLWLILGGLVLILLIIGLIFAFVDLPKATISVSTDATNVNANLNLDLSTTATSLDPSNNTIPAKLVNQQKTYTQQVATTGQKNTGNKAQGSVNMNAGSCSGTVPGNVPSGTGVTANGQTYITQSDVSFTPTVSHGKCTFQGVGSDGQDNIPIIAQSGGASSNTPGGSTFNVPGGISATGSASGGTDNIVQTVNQNDINNAKSKINTSDTTVKQALQNQLQQGNYFAIPATFSPGAPAVTASATVGEVANNVTVTEVVTYTMFGVKEDDLKTLVDNNVKTQIDTSKQSILDEGLSNAVFSVNSNNNSTAAQLAMQTTAEAGPQIDVNSIKQDAAGKKPGDIKSQLQSNPDVKSVNVKLSPFWVSSVPKKTSRITVNIAKPTTTASKAHANNP